jgi:hypothetical protein
MINKKIHIRRDHSMKVLCDKNHMMISIPMNRVKNLTDTTNVCGKCLRIMKLLKEKQ